MAEIELDLARREAGAAYLVALEKLGLVPDALFWAYDEREHRFVLVLATEMFDLKGPLAVSQLLFTAYNAAATPKEIEPFSVRLHSPNHAVIRGLKRGKGSAGRERAGRIVGAPNHVAIGAASSDLRIQPDFFYRFDLPQRRPPGELIRSWNELEQNVGRLAA